MPFGGAKQDKKRAKKKTKQDKKGLGKGGGGAGGGGDGAGGGNDGCGGSGAADSSFEKFCEAANIHNPGMAKLFLDEVCSSLRQSRTVGLSMVVKAAAASENVDPYLYFLSMTAKDYSAELYNIWWMEPHHTENYYLISLMQSNCTADATAESMQTLAAEAKDGRDLYRQGRFEKADKLGVIFVSVPEFID